MNPAGEDVRYSDHLLLRLRLREIDSTLPEKIYRSAKERYYDVATDLLVAVRAVRYKGTMRDVAVIYREKNDEVLLITIHPLKQRQKENRIQAHRWRKL